MIKGVTSMNVKKKCHKNKKVPWFLNYSRSKGVPDNNVDKSPYAYFLAPQIRRI